ncbi:hypothetical protein D3C78_1819340 [compost metagenome]
MASALVQEGRQYSRMDQLLAANPHHLERLKFVHVARKISESGRLLEILNNIHAQTSQ